MAQLRLGYELNEPMWRVTMFFRANPTKMSWDERAPSWTDVVQRMMGARANQDPPIVMFSKKVSD